MSAEKQVPAGVQLINTDVGLIGIDVEPVNTDVEFINTDVESANIDVGIINIDVEPINIDVGLINTDVEFIHIDVGFINIDVEFRMIFEKLPVTSIFFGFTCIFDYIHLSLPRVKREIKTKQV
ncbi:MAG: hypothetical protein LBR86_08655 [Tannerella sp.]|jgi:hypothetical protein|nr:hypothetical protein [Tannerella sp.]